MKKSILIALTVVGLSANLSAQGTISLQNATITPKVYVNNGGVVSLAGNPFTVQLLGGPIGGSLTPLITFTSTTGSGIFYYGNAIAIPGAPAGGGPADTNLNAALQIIAWTGNYTNLAQAQAAGALIGQTKVFNNPTGGGGSPPAPPANLTGSTNSSLVTLTVPPVTFTISGSVELQSFSGTNRMIRFVMSQLSGEITNYLQTNDVTLNFTGGMASYNLQVPTNTTHISAKTAWTLRRRQAVNFTNSTATMNFTGAANLRGGDIVTVSGGTIVDTDNAVTSSDYLLLLGNYLQTVGGNTAIGRADIDGDGAITSSDYLLLLGNYLTTGDPQ